MSTGGSYIIQADGSRALAEEPTRQHAGGDAPRTAGGLLIGADGRPVTTPAPVAPRRRAPRPVPATPPAPAPAATEET